MKWRVTSGYCTRSEQPLSDTAKPSGVKNANVRLRMARLASESSPQSPYEHTSMAALECFVSMNAHEASQSRRKASQAEAWASRQFSEMNIQLSAMGKSKNRVHCD